LVLAGTDWQASEAPPVACRLELRQDLRRRDFVVLTTVIFHDRLELVKSLLAKTDSAWSGRRVPGSFAHSFLLPITPHGTMLRILLVIVAAYRVLRMNDECFRQRDRMGDGVIILSQSQATYHSQVPKIHWLFN
jgi:hypothetical protein